MNENQNNQNAEQFQAKTVVGGKAVSIKQAQKMEEAFNNQNNNQTGIQPHHDNSTESVQAGEVAQNQMYTQEEKMVVNQWNVQSGMQPMNEISGQQAQTQEMKKQQADKEAIQKSIDANAKGQKAKAKKDN
jgi:hypothetical protein